MDGFTKVKVWISEIFRPICSLLGNPNKYPVLIPEFCSPTQLSELGL